MIVRQKNDWELSERNKHSDKDINHHKGKENLIYRIPVSILILKTVVSFGNTVNRDGRLDPAL